MSSSFLIVPIAAGAFVATNLDNLALLAAFLVRFRHRTIIVSSAYLASVLILGLGGYGISYAAEFVAVEHIAWLGLVPISLGIAGVVKLFRENAPASFNESVSFESSRIAFLATITSQIGNGADTILTFGTLFADSNPAADILIAITIAAMACVFLVGARYAVGHPGLRKSIDKHAHQITPFILIIVGAYILADTATDLV